MRACARHQYFRGEGREAEVGRWLENPRLGKLLPRLARIGLSSYFLIGQPRTNHFLPSLAKTCSYWFISMLMIGFLNGK